MKRFWILAMIVATGCIGGEDGSRTVTPLVTPEAGELHFSMQDFESNQIDLRWNVGAATLAGERIEFRGLADDQLPIFCRHRVAGAATLADPTAVVAELEAAQLATLTGDLCAEVALGCGGPDTYLGVVVNDAGSRYTMQPSMCETLVAGATLQPALEAAFASLSPVVERVEWSGTEWQAVGPCDASAQR